MRKDDLVEKIHHAKKLHLKWVHRVKDLLEGVLLTDEMIALDPKESEFGYWLYGDVHECQDIPFFIETLNHIEEEHISLHQIYFEIYRIYFVETKREYPAALLLGKRKEVPPERWAEAEKHYYELLEISHKLLVQMNNFERKVRMINDEVLQKCSRG